MYFTARERNLLRLLTGHEQLRTVKELAGELGVSERTIHRDLSVLEKTLDGFGLSLRKQAGVGVSLEGDPTGVESLRAALTGAPETDFTPEERKTHLLCTLLETSEPVKLTVLARDLGVAPATVRQDLERVEDWLHPFDLALVKKRGWGIQVIGGENNRRAAMRSLLADHVDEAEILGLLKQSLGRKALEPSGIIMERLLGLVERERLVQVEEAVQAEIGGLPYTLADSAYIGLVVHVALALERIEKGETLRFDPDLLQSLQQGQEHEVAKKIAARLAVVSDKEVPDAEIANIVLHLRGAKRGDDRGFWFEDDSGTTVAETRELIRRVGEEIDVPLEQDPSLIRGLLAHLERAVYRMKENLPIHNPLLERIETDYPELFETVGQVMEETFPHYEIPREEIGYLVMHFGAALERRQRGRPLHALAICASGIGTSKLLASRLQTEFPEIVRVDTASFGEVRRTDPQKYDLILSTIPVEMDGIDYIRVNPYLSEGDAVRIRSYLNERRRRQAVKMQPERTGEVTDEPRILESMKTIRKTAEIALTLLEGYSLSSLRDSSLSGVLQKACGRLEAEGILHDAATVAGKLAAREQLGGLGIPGTGMALFHGRSDRVWKPSFTMYNLEQPLEVEGMDGNRMEMTRLLLLLAPEKEEEAEQELLSRISALTIEVPALFQSGGEGDIRAFLAEQLNRTLHEKLDEQRSVEP
ncbi:BglG family transcription antiterminator [Desmospora profundinema]|uniref:Mannitol operon transcriptional antiterminator n=1 Tax=Desmospora profundinema TaxID=1571184 RepID=A0ABU1IHR9_9BACL|nr:BglG family transcription antiterminator [Desmospora profundinema]MDR6224318.1 mannitol operon transcriptional antiterminator [Desmospora profundinema]